MLNATDNLYPFYSRERLSSGGSECRADTLESLTERPSTLVWTLTLVSSISGFLFGYDTGYISSVLVAIGTELGGAELSIKQREYISSATSFGALVASLFAGALADAVGRKFAIMACDVFFVVGAGTQVLAKTVAGMVVGRLIMGFGVGVGSLCAPLYIAELSPSRFRGRLVTTNCLAITGGQLAAYLVGAFAGATNNSWRLVIAGSLLPCSVQLLAVFFLPDTPRYLVMKNRYLDAVAVLKRIYPGADEDRIHASVEELQASNNSGDAADNSALQRSKSSWTELFEKHSNRRALVIACGLQAIQQFVGFNALMYFSSSIFQMVGFRNSTLVSCVVAGTNFVVTILALVIIDKVGRRRILLYSIPLLLLSQLLCALSFSHLHIDGENSGYWKYILVLSLMLFVAFYSVGLGNVPWQQSELFPQRVRGLGSSLSTATNWFGSMVLSFSFLSLMDSISPSSTFLMFSFNSLLSFVFVYFLYPELSGLQLEQVQELLNEGFNVSKSIELHNSSFQKRHTEAYQFSDIPGDQVI